MSREPLVEDGVIAGNVFDKYHSRNPLVRRLMGGYRSGLDALLAQVGSPRTVLEVGCGEGYVTAHIARRFPRARVLGTDFSSKIVSLARVEHPELQFQVCSIYDAATLGAWDVVLACEVLEHLEEPARGLEAICAHSPGHVVITVPREPIWRALNMARGRYWSALGNTTGHLQHWTRASLLRFLASRLEILDVRSPLPWTQVLGRPRPATRP